MQLTRKTIQRYNTQGPRYTSYPTAPTWSSDVNSNIYTDKLKVLGQTDKPISLYIHIPFCQKMCYFCGCMVKIRERTNPIGNDYLTLLKKEIELVAQNLGQKQTVLQFHIGGGTPNFLNETQMEQLLRIIKKHFNLDSNGEIAIEVDPRTVSLDQVRHYRELGFNRISMGIQDFEPKVQEAINRIQPFDLVKNIYNECRKQNYTSINFDLIYGLPLQTEDSFLKTAQLVTKLKPDRIAFYSFAHVPWLKKHQKLIKTEDLPSADQKLNIFLKSRKHFLNSSYDAIAMDHFALNSDEMATAFKKGELFRNFMGYTLKYTEDFIGLGMSSIGYVKDTFIQNTKDLKKYKSALNQNKLPTSGGKILSDDDLKRQWVIHQLMCHFTCNKKDFEHRFKEKFDTYFAAEVTHLKNCQEEGLIEHTETTITATNLGQFFIRNVCMGFDAYLGEEVEQRFSQTV